MTGYIVLLWILLKLHAPWWCYLLLALGFLGRLITFVLKYIDD